MDLMERGVTHNLYNTDLYTAMETIYNIWFEMESSIFYNCWVKTGLIQPINVIIKLVIRSQHRDISNI